MFCRKCGKEIPDDSEFCPKCGTAVKENSRKNEQPSSRSLGGAKELSDADRKKLDELHAELEQAKKKQENDNNNVLLSFYSTDSLRPLCEQIKKIDNNDFFANDCLVSSYCQRLDRSDFRKDFDKTIECARIALDVCPENDRTQLAKSYYEMLIGKIAKLFDRLENEYCSLSDTNFFGESDQSRYVEENAERDYEVFKSLCELSRIPYLTKSFLDLYTSKIRNVYKKIGYVYYTLACIKVHGVSYDAYCMEELRRNYPQYY